MNRVFIIGNLTADPQSKTTQDGKNVTNFTVACNRRQTATQKQNGQQAEADFFRVSAWNAMGENCQKYLTKGRKVAVVGSVSVHAYMGQDGTAKASLEVLAQDVEFLSPVGNGEQAQAAAAPAQAAAEMPVNMTPVAMTEGDLPF